MLLNIIVHCHLSIMANKYVYYYCYVVICKFVVFFVFFFCLQKGHAHTTPGVYFQYYLSPIMVRFSRIVFPYIWFPNPEMIWKLIKLLHAFHDFVYRFGSILGTKNEATRRANGGLTNQHFLSKSVLGPPSRPKTYPSPSRPLPNPPRSISVPIWKRFAMNVCSIFVLACLLACLFAC